MCYTNTTWNGLDYVFLLGIISLSRSYINHTKTSVKYPTNLYLFYSYFYDDNNEHHCYDLTDHNVQLRILRKPHYQDSWSWSVLCRRILKGQDQISPRFRVLA